MTLLPPLRADRLRRVLLAIGGLVGLATAAYLLNSQPTVDFLREGPARVLPLEGGELRVLLAAGTAAATVVAVAVLWRGLTIPALIVSAAALGVGFLLVHVVFTPTLGLVVLAVVVHLAGSIDRERVAEAGPRHYPLRWGIGAVAGVIGLVVFAAISWWLASPLFVEGERLEEGLGFQVTGVMQPTATATSPAAATPAAGAAIATATAEQGDTASTGELIAMGDLEGSDSFHTASGEVLLVRGPEGDLILRFQDYDVRNGPDLFIYLTPDPDGDVHVDGAIELSEIKATSGFVNYDVPTDADAESFRAAVIYCKAFSVTFAVAQFQ